jgi:hypothetical protein
MRIAVTAVVAGVLLSVTATAAPPANGAKPSPGDKPAGAKPAPGDKAQTDKADKTDPGGGLAERRAAAALQKAADSAKRLFPKYDANRDGALDETEWTKAQPAIDKMVDGEVLKTSGARRELVREALQGMTRPQPPRSGSDVTPEAVEQYARDLLAAATEVADNAQPEVVPLPPPQRGRHADSGDEEEPRRGRLQGRRIPNPNATAEERAREEALRRKGLREEDGKIGPIVPNRPGNRPQGNRPQGNGAGPNRPGTRP